MEQFINIDYVILGEGEVVFFEITRRIEVGNVNEIKNIKVIVYRKGKEIIANKNPGIDLNKVSKIKIYTLYILIFDITFNFFKDALHSSSIQDLLRTYRDKIGTIKSHIDFF